MDVAKLEAIKSRLTMHDLKRGDVLFEQNEPADGIYIVLSGRMEVIANLGKGKSRRVGFVGRSETVGEMALLSDDLRSASVVCFRNAVLAKMDKKTFLELCYSNSEFALQISRFIVGRLKESIQVRRPRFRLSNVSIHDSGRSETTNEVISDLLDVFRWKKKVAIIDESWIDQVLDMKQADVVLRPEDYVKLDQFLNELEQEDKLLFFDLRRIQSELIRHLVDYSDVAIEFFDAALSPKQDLKQESVIQSIPNIQSKAYYVVCHSRDSKSHPKKTSLLVNQLKEGPHANIKAGNEKDLQRLERYITGRSVGMVLGGGGAKGIAHLGAIKALEEAGIPIDYIAGTSMGAIYASLYAIYRDFKEVFKLSTQAFVKSPTGLMDLNLIPRYSIFKDKKIVGHLQHLYSDMELEDLWLPFYCISSNLTKPEMTIHEKGKLKDIIRTSMAVPGLFKPILIDNNLHVDGGVFNNIPIDVMMQKNLGYIIASRVDKDSARSATKLPNFMNTLIKATSANSDYHSNRLGRFVDIYFQPDVTDFGLLNWKAHDKIFELGYLSAVKVLEEKQDLVNQLKVDS